MIMATRKRELCKMKKLIVSVLIVLLLLTVIITPALATSNPAFADVSTSEWFHPYVRWANAHGIMQGTGGGNFSPNTAMTRAQLVTVLWRIDGEPTPTYNANFSDVTAKQWYTDAVNWAASRAIVGGVGGGRFAPHDNITREQFATVLNRWAIGMRYLPNDMPYPTVGAISHFHDRSLVSDWAVSALEVMVTFGVVGGTSPTTLNPQGDATRAQGAALIARLTSVSHEYGWQAMPIPPMNTLPQPDPEPPSNEQALDEAVRSGITYRQLLQTYPNADVQAAFEREVIRLVNNIRGEHGLVPFIHHPSLAWLARARTDEIIRHNCLGGHVSPTTGLSHTDHARAMGLEINFAGEITVRGGVTPQIAVDTWMNSEPHRRSLLYDGDGRLHVGVGFSHGDTNDFGTAWSLWRSTPPR